jgi:8-oxo-dGTP diphosphatase
MPSASTCLCLLTRDRADGVREVLLGHKKTGFGTGKVVAPGGHVEAGETAAEAAAREVKEETSLHVMAGSLSEAARIEFRFPVRPAWDMQVTVFAASDFVGEAAESDEIRPEWFPLSALPFDRMWQDAAHWLPRTLAGERLVATFTYAPDNESVAAVEITSLR